MLRRTISVSLLYLLFALDVGCGVRSALGTPASRTGDGGTTSNAIVIMPEALPAGRVREGYDVTLTATGGVGAPYVFTRTDGALPPGLELDAAGRLSGSPTRAGTFSFTVQARDGAGSTGTRAYTLRVEGPRWIAYREFESTSSTRVSLSLLDYTKPDSRPIVLHPDRASVPRFSPDGRFLLYVLHSSTGVEPFVMDVSGETPGPAVAVSPEGKVLSEYAIAWAEDGRHLAFARATATGSSLFVCAPDAVEITTRTHIADDIGQVGVAWHGPSTLVYEGSDGRSRLVRDATTTPRITTLDVPDGRVVVVSRDGARVLLADTTRYYLASGDTGVAVPLSTFEAWEAPPELDVLLGRNFADGAFAYHALSGATLGPVLHAGAGLSFVFDLEWAHTYSAIALGESGRMVISTYRGGVVTRETLSGPVGDIDVGVFTHDDSRVVWADGPALWLGFPSPDIPIVSVEVTRLGSPIAEVRVAPHAHRALVSGGSPVTSRVVDLDPDGGFDVTDVSLGFTWSESAFSADAGFVAFVGARPVTGRALYLRDLGAPDARLVGACTRATVPPTCPDAPTFQP